VDVVLILRDGEPVYNVDEVTWDTQHNLDFPVRMTQEERWHTVRPGTGSDGWVTAGTVHLPDGDWRFCHEILCGVCGELQTLISNRHIYLQGHMAGHGREVTGHDDAEEQGLVQYTDYYDFANLRTLLPAGEPTRETVWTVMRGEWR
jgi:hypothetical protein